MLFGELYFSGKNKGEVSKNIKEKSYIIQDSHLISPESKDLLRRCLEKDKTKRITAPEAKNHKLFESVK